nr:MAG TPA: hypothetical protein [Caudoviricetes sp.]
MIELTKSEASSLMDFIEFNIFNAIRNDEEIDSVTWLENMMSIYRKCKEVQNEETKV